MVKIINRLGEVKIGKQGEVVYQRKYGEQMRRLVSPKMAIASEAQIKHRQRYRDALDWRKGLSRPNRRYLEGYCIANGVVDGYHIPLPWHRFALKLYLEHIHFVLTDISITEPSYKEKKFESYETGDNSPLDISASKWPAQTFTPTEAHKIVKVSIKILRVGTVGTLYVSIKNTNGVGKPTGPDLCSGSMDASGVTTDPVGDWYDIQLGDGYDLLLNTTYAKVYHIVGGDASNKLQWRYDSTGTYTIGQLLYSNDSGGKWTPYPNFDCMFQEFGRIAIEGKKTATLHVRHPALSTIVHKRGELIITEYENLSSLDEEYLTKQVGIDVEVGDIIEATSIAGIQEKYQVR